MKMVAERVGRPIEGDDSDEARGEPKSRQQVRQPRGGERPPHAKFGFAPGGEQQQRGGDREREGREPVGQRNRGEQNGGGENRRISAPRAGAPEGEQRQRQQRESGVVRP